MRSSIVLFVISFALASVTACTSVNTGLRLYERGNCAAAVIQWLPLANRGDPIAQNNMGVIWESGCPRYGDGIPVNHVEAYNWYMLAATNGAPIAMYNLGHVHEEGLGVDRSMDKALVWYRLAARHAEPKAQARLAALGIEVPIPDLVVQEASANDGNIAAEMALAFLSGVADGYAQRSRLNVNVTTSCRTRVVGNRLYTDCR